jgi:4-amino-4-deoxy-L-arabinose transferase-like glycosyltransferase
MNNGEKSPGAFLSAKAVRLCLVAIIVLATLVRIVGLGRVPPPLFRDEAEKGYNAYCLLKTGCDYEGRRLPLFINVFGTYTSAIYQYASIPWIGLFGLKVWTTRLTAALAGIATVLFLYLLARALLDPPTALVAAAILAISPWHVCFSRWAQQGIFMPLLFTIAAWGTVRFRQGWRPGLPVAAAAIGFAAYAYDVGRVLAPLFLLLLAVVAKQELRKYKGWAVASALVLAILVAPTLWFVTHQPEEALARFRRISIAQPGMLPAQIVGRFVANYAAHFNPVYLAIQGDSELRHSPRHVGEIHPLEFPFLLVGLYFLARKRGAAAWVVIGWMAIGPVASSMTQVGIPHALRSLAGVPAFALAIAVGLIETVRGLPDKVSRRTVAGLFLGAELALAAVFLYRYFVAYPDESAQAWQAGFDEALAFCNRDTGADVYVSEQAGGLILPPEIISPVEVLVAFFEKIPPQQFQAGRLRQTRFRVLPWGADLPPLRKEFHRIPNETKWGRKWYANLTFVIGEIAGRIPDGFGEQIYVDNPGFVRVHTLYPKLQ